MWIRSCAVIALFAAIPVWSQVDTPSATGEDTADSSQMLVPPPVSGEAFPTAVRGETRSNYLRGGVNVSTAYIDNLYAGSGRGAISETIYTIRPTVAFDQTTERQQRTLSYSPGYTFYQPSSALNEVDQNATAFYRYRFAPHVAMNVNDTFRRSSSAFGTGDTPSGSVTGSPQASNPGIIAPFAEQLANNASAELTVQATMNSMVGISGTDGILQFPNHKETAGLFNSDSRSGAAFYDHRFSGIHYFGINYAYAETLAFPASGTSTTVTHTISAYYSIYPMRSLSLSVSGGPQYYEVSETTLASSKSWNPSWMASANWQGMRATFAASYSRSVSGGGGLLGAYRTTTANGSARWRVSHRWNVGVGGVYFLNKSVTPLGLMSSGNGHSVSENVRVSDSLSTHLSLDFAYDHVHQDYAAIQSVALSPDGNRETISLSWQFNRPIGQ